VSKPSALAPSEVIVWRHISSRHFSGVDAVHCEPMRDIWDFMKMFLEHSISEWQDANPCIPSAFAALSEWLLCQTLKAGSQEFSFVHCFNLLEPTDSRCPCSVVFHNILYTSAVVYGQLMQGFYLQVVQQHGVCNDLSPCIHDVASCIAVS